MNRRRFLLTAALGAAFPAFPAFTRADEPVDPAPEEWVELHRLRIVNFKDGAVQVSTDSGATWNLLGRVTSAATTVAEGYLASNYAEPGTVSATAVHGIRIRTGGDDPTLHAPLTLSINPSQYSALVVGKAQGGFGGHVAGSAGIFVDIPAGASIFRSLAPYAGNPVYLEGRSGQLLAMPGEFRPMADRETLVIVVRRPKNPLVEVVFPNRGRADVIGKYADGSEKVLTTVFKPVRGVGRFDGTAYTGVGRINTAHTGVITVSTAPFDSPAPESGGPERRGGFQISPAWHNARTEETGADMVLTLGPVRTRTLEGKPPLFRDTISLVDDPEKPAIVDVSVDDGPWEPMPKAVGAQLDCFTGPGLTRLWKSQGKSRTTAKGVTAFRMTLPLLSTERSQKIASTAASQYRTQRLAAARAGKLPLVSGRLTINANPTDPSKVAFVRFSVEGTPRGFTNSAPFSFTWDTTSVADGEYLVEAEAMDASGGVVTATRRRVFVLNTA